MSCLASTGVWMFLQYHIWTCLPKAGYWWSI